MKFFKTLILLVCVGCFVPLALAQTTKAKKVAPDAFYSNNAIIGTVAGEDIRIGDVMNKKIHDLMGNLYNALEQQLAQLALEKLAKTNQDFQMPAIAITDQQINDFYLKNQLKKRGTLEQYQSQIKQYLTQQQRSTQLASHYARAFQQGLVKTYLEPPPEFLVSAFVGTAVIRTEANARVMFLEFSDYQCPYCSKAQGAITNLMEKYKGQVVFGYRHFPLAFHKEADEAANAVECAREQGKFEEMHKILYANQRQQFPDDLKNYGRRIKIKNLTQFDQCLDQGKYRDLVQNDIKAGAAIGINGTPGFIIGTYDPKTKKVTGEVLSGALPQENFEQLIQKYLNKKS